MKKQLKEHTSLLILISILVVGIGSSYYNGMFEPDYKYNEAKLWVQELQLECEMGIGVPNNYYTGIVKITQNSKSSLLLTLMLPIGAISDEQRTDLEQRLNEKIYEMPCADEYKQLDTEYRKPYD